MTSAKILAIGGISSSVISMCAGGLAQWSPQAGVVMISIASFVMLFANLWVALWKDRT